jgi:hypothetical protein
MSTLDWTLQPNGRISHRGHREHGGLHTVLSILAELGEILAFSYRLRTGHALRHGARAAPLAGAS